MTDNVLCVYRWDIVVFYDQPNTSRDARRRRPVVEYGPSDECKPCRCAHLSCVRRYVPILCFRGAYTDQIHVYSYHLLRRLFRPHPLQALGRPRPTPASKSHAIGSTDPRKTFDNSFRIFARDAHSPSVVGLSHTFTYAYLRATAPRNELALPADDSSRILAALPKLGRHRLTV